MGCNCGNKNKRSKALQQIARVQASRNVNTPNGLTAKEYLKQLNQSKKK